MNRNITLILSAAVVVVLLAIWIYIMFFASPKDQGPIEGSGTYSGFGELGGDATGEGTDSGDGVGGDDLTGGDDPETDTYDPDILRQLTTRNVIGYREVEIASSTHVIFMESGAGHIYSIDLSNGIEERVSATTIPDARVAEFSSDGMKVAVKTGESTGINPISLAHVDINNSSVSLEPVAELVAQFTFTDDDTLLYTVVNNSSVSVKSYDFEDGSSSNIFDTPFREAKIDLGSSVNGPHYFWPKTSQSLEGFVYKVNNGGQERLPVDGFGFAANALGEEVIASYRDIGKFVTVLYDSSMEAPMELSIDIIPDKCVGGEEALYCAVAGNGSLQYYDADLWYRGTKSFSDNLWMIEGETVQQLINITGHTGRKVDVMNGGRGELTDSWYFQNKLDNTLWVYELARLGSEEDSEDNTDDI